jgi:hypothetical protein
MAAHMIIAPGEEIDRTWLVHPSSVILFVADSIPAATFGDFEVPEIQHATLRRYWHPAWKVLLSFYVDDRLSTNIPAGYVMPGWIPGQQLEQCSLEDRDNAPLCDHLGCHLLADQGRATRCMKENS